MTSWTCHPVTDKKVWNQQLSTLPAHHVLQSWQWGEVKQQFGWTPIRLCWKQGDQVVAAAQILQRAIPYLPLSIAYVTKGPALDYENSLLVDTVLHDLEQWARRQRAISLKIDPDTNLDTVIEALDERGWRYSNEQIQFQNTGLLDLSRSEKDLMAAMKSKTRYNIRLAQRKGVHIRVGTANDLAHFYEMYAETGKRNGFIIRSQAYYAHTWQTFMDEGMAHLLLADVHGETVSGILLFYFGDMAWYMYGASTNQHRNLMPNYLLQWEAICWTQARGLQGYDMWGAPDTLNEQDSMWGVWRFKEGLGAQFTPHIGAYDYPAFRLLYWAYAVMLPKYVGLLQKRHKA